MTRVVSVGRSQGLFLASTLGIAMLVSLSGCPGTLENPSDFPSGAAGASGPAGSGPAGSGPAGSGAAGTGAIADCDAPAMVFTTYSCAIAGCHGDMPAGGFDMKTAGWETHLVGQTSKGGGPAGTASMCGGNPTPYIVAGSNPATGLFIDKLTKASPPCGAAMPNIGGPLTTAEKNCVVQWATKLANP